MSPQLLALRDRIDQIDVQILTLLIERTEVVGQISVEKERLSLPVLDATRERNHLAALLAVAAARGAGSKVSAFLAAVFQDIFRASRTLQGR